MCIIYLKQILQKSSVRGKIILILKALQEVVFEYCSYQFIFHNTLLQNAFYNYLPNGQKKTLLETHCAITCATRLLHHTNLKHNQTSNAIVIMSEYYILDTMWGVTIVLVKCALLHDKWDTFNQYNGDTSHSTQNLLLIHIVTKALVYSHSYKV